MKESLTRIIEEFDLDVNKLSLFAIHNSNGDVGYVNILYTEDYESMGYGMIPAQSKDQFKNALNILKTIFKDKKKFSELSLDEKTAVSLICY